MWHFAREGHYNTRGIAGDRELIDRVICFVSGSLSRDRLTANALAPRDWGTRREFLPFGLTAPLRAGKADDQTPFDLLFRWVGYSATRP
jgi:hypothetical protein